jgi:hypothetical protein
MNFDNFTKPTLIEPGVKYFLSETLKQCRIFKNNYNNLLINISFGIVFFVILGIILLFKYKGKLTPVEKEIRNRQKQQYILSKIQNFQESKQRAHQELITGLPHWETEYDIISNKNKYIKI